jgi:hypothetical protein
MQEELKKIPLSQNYGMFLSAEKTQIWIEAHQQAHLLSFLDCSMHFNWNKVGRALLIPHNLAHMQLQDNQMRPE